MLADFYIPGCKTNQKIVEKNDDVKNGFKSEFFLSKSRKNPKNYFKTQFIFCTTRGRHGALFIL